MQFLAVLFLVVCPERFVARNNFIPKKLKLLYNKTI